jgi:asparagine N-glycosylation enzyme membrane subunit Stt3
MNDTTTMTKTAATIMPESIPNGPGAAAVLAAGIGCAALGILALANDAFPALNKLLNFYKPSGGLSGVSTVAVIVWLVAWFLLSRNWATKTVGMAKVNIVSFALLAVGVLLTFPPVMDFIQGR